MNLKRNCPICDSDNLMGFLARKNVPVHQHLLLKDYQLSLKMPLGELNLFCCNDCGFIFNSVFDSTLLRYGENYDNNQAFSPSFEKYVTELSEHLIVDENVKNNTIVEIGCGNGAFLERLVKDERNNNIGYGFDPSYIGSLTLYDGRLTFKKCYYDSECSDIRADLVICRHVLEHIEQPINFLKIIRCSLSNSTNARIFIETPSIEWILQNGVIWDFFYEHCSYFSVGSLTTAMQLSGFEVEKVEHIFNGQYLLLKAIASDNVTTIYNNNLLTLVHEFVETEKHLINIYNAQIKTLAQQGKVSLWGAGAKGVTFANLVDPEAKLIDSIVDLNPRKQGCFVAGTGHPIIHFSELPKRHIANIIIMNPNYINEVKDMLRLNDMNIPVITLQ